MSTTSFNKVSRWISVCHQLHRFLYAQALCGSVHIKIIDTILVKDYKLSMGQVETCILTFEVHPCYLRYGATVIQFSSRGTNFGKAGKRHHYFQCLQLANLATDDRYAEQNPLLRASIFLDSGNSSSSIFHFRNMVNTKHYIRIRIIRKSKSALSRR